MSQQRPLDEALAKIRSEQPSEEAVKAAAGRVFRRLFDATFITAEPTGKIRGCADVRALIPAYLQQTLSPSRVLLLDDHVLTCVDCRRALHEARFGAPAVKPIPINRATRKPVPLLVWAVAATLLVGVGLGLTGRLPGQSALRVTVASIDGTLYKVTDLTVSLVEAGAILKNTDELRTAKGSHAILRLAGGTMVEIAERSEVGISGGRWSRSASLNLQRGQMIVDARKNDGQSVNVTSGEMSIPVSGGVVAIDHGTRESRVAVANGAVEVHTGAVMQQVTAGHLYGGELRTVSLPIASEFTWSPNSAGYLELLSQFKGLQADLQAIPAPGLRYSSSLPQYLPADTFLYAAIPNLGGTITEAKKLFDSRLAESQALRDWWQQKDIAKNGDFDRIVTQISALSNYLGDEIVVSIAGDAPVFVAQIKQSGLADYLNANMPAHSNVQIVTGGAPAGAAGHELFIDLDNNILVATPSATQLTRVENIIQKTTPGAFMATPFYARISKVYQSGAGSFLAANMEQIRAKSVSNAEAAIPTGFDNVQYLVLERKGEGEMRASLSFAGERQGIASWLGAPGPAGSLNFVSPSANFAASVVMKNPRIMMRELLGMLGNSNANFQQQLNDFEAKSGVNLLNDVAEPLGSDFTIAMDGGITPLIAIEVYDQVRLQNTLQTFLNSFNQMPANAKSGHLTITNHSEGGRTFYAISSDKANALSVHYTFVDGYLLASWSDGSLVTAISNEQSGHTLVSDESFRAKLPADGYANFSAMVYSNMSSLGDLAKQVNSSQKAQLFAGLVANSGPGLICVYGETDRIVAATRGSFLGFDLGTLIHIQEGKPLQTIIANAPLGVKKEIVN